MEIITFELAPIGTNCYLVYDENKKGVLIDPASESKNLTDYVESNNITITHILLTHGHFDHIMGAKYYKERFCAPIAIGEKENEFLRNPALNSSMMIGESFSIDKADILLKEGDEIISGSLTFKVLETPGHTIGGVSYLCGENLFCGDTIFYRPIGRTDLATGDYEILGKSITQKLYTLPEDTVLFNGHGSKTTVGEEKKYNPFFRG